MLFCLVQRLSAAALRITNNNHTSSLSLSTVFNNYSTSHSYRLLSDSHFQTNINQLIIPIISVNLLSAEPIDSTLTLQTQPVKFLLQNDSVSMVIIDDSVYPNRLKKVTKVNLQAECHGLTPRVNRQQYKIYSLCQRNNQRFITTLNTSVNNATGVIQQLSKAAQQAIQITLLCPLQNLNLEFVFGYFMIYCKNTTIFDGVAAVFSVYPTFSVFYNISHQSCGSPSPIIDMVVNPTISRWNFALLTNSSLCKCNYAGNQAKCYLMPGKFNEGRDLDILITSYGQADFMVRTQKVVRVVPSVMNQSNAFNIGMGQEKSCLKLTNLITTKSYILGQLSCDRQIYLKIVGNYLIDPKVQYFSLNNLSLLDAGRYFQSIDQFFLYNRSDASLQLAYFKTHTLTITSSSATPVGYHQIRINQFDDDQKFVQTRAVKVYVSDFLDDQYYPLKENEQKKFQFRSKQVSINLRELGWGPMLNYYSLKDKQGLDLNVEYVLRYDIINKTILQLIQTQNFMGVYQNESQTNSISLVFRSPGVLYRYRCKYIEGGRFVDFCERIQIATDDCFNLTSSFSFSFFRGKWAFLITDQKNNQCLCRIHCVQLDTSFQQVEVLRYNSSFFYAMKSERRELHIYDIQKMLGNNHSLPEFCINSQQTQQLLQLSIKSAAFLYDELGLVFLLLQDFTVLCVYKMRSSSNHYHSVYEYKSKAFINDIQVFAHSKISLVLVGQKVVMEISSPDGMLVQQIRQYPLYGESKVNSEIDSDDDFILIKTQNYITYYRYKEQIPNRLAQFRMEFPEQQFSATQGRQLLVLLNGSILKLMAQPKLVGKVENETEVYQNLIGIRNQKDHLYVIKANISFDFQRDSIKVRAINASQKQFKFPIETVVGPIHSLKSISNDDAIVEDMLKPYKYLFNQFIQQKVQSGLVLSVQTFNCSEFQFNCQFRWGQSLLLLLAEKQLLLVQGPELKVRMRRPQQREMSSCKCSFLSIDANFAKALTVCLSKDSQFLQTKMIQIERGNLSVSFFQLRNQEDLYLFQMTRIKNDLPYFLVSVPLISPSVRIRNVYVCLFDLDTLVLFSEKCLRLMVSQFQDSFRSFLDNTSYSIDNKILIVGILTLESFYSNAILVLKVNLEERKQQKTRRIEGFSNLISVQIIAMSEDQQQIEMLHIQQQEIKRLVYCFQKNSSFMVEQYPSSGCQRDTLIYRNGNFTISGCVKASNYFIQLFKPRCQKESPLKLWPVRMMGVQMISLTKLAFWVFTSQNNTWLLLQSQITGLVVFRAQSQYLIRMQSEQAKLQVCNFNECQQVEVRFSNQRSNIQVLYVFVGVMLLVGSIHAFYFIRLKRKINKQLKQIQQRKQHRFLFQPPKGKRGFKRAHTLKLNLLDRNQDFPKTDLRFPHSSSFIALQQSD